MAVIQTHNGLLQIGPNGLFQTVCDDGKYKVGIKTIYQRDYKYRKEDPADIVKWMRRNFDERGQGWDFSLVGGRIEIEIWDDKFITMYEMWHM